MEHTGDNLTGEGEGDDEQIKVSLATVPADVDKIVFPVSIYDAETRQQSFGQVRNAFIRVVNQANNEELARYDLSEDASTETAMVFGELYRHGAEWKFRAIGQATRPACAASRRTSASTSEPTCSPSGAAHRAAPDELSRAGSARAPAAGHDEGEHHATHRTGGTVRATGARTPCAPASHGCTTCNTSSGRNISWASRSPREAMSPSPGRTRSDPGHGRTRLGRALHDRSALRPRRQRSPLPGRQDPRRRVVRLLQQPCQPGRLRPAHRGQPHG